MKEKFEDYSSKEGSKEEPKDFFSLTWSKQWNEANLNNEDDFNKMIRIVEKFEDGMDKIKAYLSIRTKTSSYNLGRKTVNNYLVPAIKEVGYVSGFETLKSLKLHMGENEELERAFKKGILVETWYQPDKKDDDGTAKYERYFIPIYSDSEEDKKLRERLDAELKEEEEFHKMDEEESPDNRWEVSSHTLRARDIF